MLRADDGAYREGRGCYTTGRFAGGRIRHRVRSARRLARDAARLGLGVVDPEVCVAAMQELGAAAFGNGEGIVRLQASRDGNGLHLVGVPRAVGPEPPGWRVVSAPFSHDGPGPWGGAKLTGRLRLAWAREHARTAGVEETLLFDSADRLVEGARSNVVVVREDGALVTPDLERGAVAGVAREILIEALPELQPGDVSRSELLSAREIVMTNSVRGARPVVELDGAAVGSGAPGAWAARLDAILDEDDPGSSGTDRAGA